MAEIAGLVLGTLPLLVLALDQYSKRARILKKYVAEIETFQCDIQIQQMKFTTFLSNIGLREPTPDELCERIKSKFPKTADKVLHLIREMDKDVEDLVQKLDCRSLETSTVPDAPRRGLKRIANIIQVEKRMQAIERLKKYNGMLLEYLVFERSNMQTERVNPTVQGLIQRFNMDKSNALRQSLASFHRALNVSHQCACSASLQTALYLDWNSYELADQTDFKLAVSHQLPQDAIRWCKLHATPGTAASASSNQNMHQSPVSQHNAASHQTPPPTPSQRSILPERSRRKHKQRRSKSVMQIQGSTQPAVLGPTPPVSPPTISFCELMTSGTGEHCLQHNDRSFVLRHNRKDKVMISSVIPFEEFYQQDYGEELSRLSRRTRYSLAAGIASGLLHLSSSPGLGDDWDGKRFGVFVETSEDDGEKLAEHPCFQYNDATQNSNVNESVESQPEPMLGMSVRLLGIFLVELCLGKSLTPHGTSPNFFLRWREAKNSFKEVYDAAGVSFGDATKKCIHFCLSGRDEDNSFAKMEFRETFYNEVVAPIQDTYNKYRVSS